MIRIIKQTVKPLEEDLKELGYIVEGQQRHKDFMDGSWICNAVYYYWAEDNVMEKGKSPGYDSEVFNFDAQALGSNQSLAPMVEHAMDFKNVAQTFEKKFDLEAAKYVKENEPDPNKKDDINPTSWILYVVYESLGRELSGSGYPGVLDEILERNNLGLRFEGAARLIEDEFNSAFDDYEWAMDMIEREKNSESTEGSKDLEVTEFKAVKDFMKKIKKVGKLFKKNKMFIKKLFTRFKPLRKFEMAVKNRK